MSDTLAFSSSRWAGEIVTALELADRAAQLVVEMRASVGSSTKLDGSIVTDADVAAAALYRSALAQHFPDDGILTEEDAAGSDRGDRERYWLVDPIDGTRQYADGSAEFDTYIALIHCGKPVLGVAVQPTTGVAVVAADDCGVMVRDAGRWTRLRFEGESREPLIGTRPWLGAPGNLPQLAAATASLNGRLRDPVLPISVRSFLPGSDSLDAVVGLYLPGAERESYEWDLAVLDVVLRAAGGATCDLRGYPLRFNRPDPRFPEGVILARSPLLARRLVAALGG